MYNVLSQYESYILCNFNKNIYHRPISTVTKMTAKKNIAFNATNFHIATIYMYIAIW